jgi:hypothetical protein
VTDLRHLQLNRAASEILGGKTDNAREESRQHRRADRLGRNPFQLCSVHVGVCATRVDPSRSVERLCLARRVRHAAQLANVMGLVNRPEPKSSGNLSSIGRYMADMYRRGQHWPI